MSADVTQRLRAAARRVDELPEIVRRSGGVLGSVATYLPGDQIVGLRLRGDTAEVHVVMSWSATVDDVETAVVSALAAEGFAAVHVVIDDIAEPPGGIIEPASD